MPRLGFKPLNGRAHALSNATIVQHIAYRRVTVKHDIEAIDGRELRFSDGTTQQFDVLIAATGYLIDFPFLPDDLIAVRDNGVELYNRIVPPDWPGLYFMDCSISMEQPTKLTNGKRRGSSRWKQAMQPFHVPRRCASRSNARPPG